PFRQLHRRWLPARLLAVRPLGGGHAAAFCSLSFAAVHSSLLIANKIQENKTLHCTTSQYIASHCIASHYTASRLILFLDLNTEFLSSLSLSSLPSRFGSRGSAK